MEKNVFFLMEAKKGISLMTVSLRKGWGIVPLRKKLIFHKTFFPRPLSSMGGGGEGN